MWTFRDEEGRKWEVVVGRESWGGFVALFLPDDPDGEVLEAGLDVSSRSEATRRIDELGRRGWLSLLARSRPKDTG